MTVSASLIGELSVKLLDSELRPTLQSVTLGPNNNIVESQHSQCDQTRHHFTACNPNYGKQCDKSYRHRHNKSKQNSRPSQTTLNYDADIITHLIRLTIAVGSHPAFCCFRRTTAAQCPGMTRSAGRTLHKLDSHTLTIHLDHDSFVCDIIAHDDFKYAFV